jgi:hypothetical protein
VGHYRFVCLVFQNRHALGYLKSVTGFLCTNFWVNKSLSMMWQGNMCVVPVGGCGYWNWCNFKNLYLLTFTIISTFEKRSCKSSRSWDAASNQMQHGSWVNHAILFKKYFIIKHWESVLLFCNFGKNLAIALFSIEVLGWMLLVFRFLLVVSCFLATCFEILGLFWWFWALYYINKLSLIIA